MSSRVESVEVPGGSFDLPVWLPDGGTGPGLLLIQEIFGISDYIRDVADDLAGLGYVVAAPDLFWRLEPGFDAKHNQEGLAKSLEMGQRFDFQQGVADSVAALNHLRDLPEAAGGIGVIGFCMGGTVAYFVAGQTEVAALVSYYGSGVQDSLELLDQITAPVQFQYGGNDSYIPRDQVARVEAAAVGKPNVEVHVEEDAGHAFHNRKNPMFHMPEPAERAWRRTEEFLHRHLPTPHHSQTPAS
jgi:carboxymethylenebutenolidase